MYPPPLRSLFLHIAARWAHLAAHTLLPLLAALGAVFAAGWAVGRVPTDLRPLPLWGCALIGGAVGALWAAGVERRVRHVEALLSPCPRTGGPHAFEDGERCRECGQGAWPRDGQP